ncbi:hypothetical protein ACOJB9_16000 [Carnobacterium maltaromaticum]|uniref:hypothetical protein n=1 Tax=Carnobacterium maltaromaticum TaxID=2751 RepID=UPI003C22A4CA
MTNKLEEVLKELQESHVLVDREEYEKLVEKAKNAKEIEIEAEPKFLIGEYYTIGLDAYTREIFMVIYAEDILKAKTYRVSYDNFRIMSTALKGNSFVVTDSKLATDEEIKLFKRAAMYHKHGRKLDDLKVGDLIKIGKGIYQMKNETTGFIQSIIEGRHELYLTIEEAQEAHKKIVGE